MLTAFVTWDKSNSLRTKEAAIEVDIKLSRINSEFASVSLFLLVCCLGSFF